jgi:hypothetical protein
MFTHGKLAVILVDGYNVSGFLSSFNFNATADIAETSTFGNTSKSYVLGLQDNTLSVEGFYTDGSAEIVALLNAALGAATNQVWTIFPQLSTLGLDCWGFVASQTSISVDVNMGGAVSISGDAQSSVGAELLISHHALGAETGTTASPSVDGAAATTTGGVGYLHVTALTGTNVVVKIQDSADDSTFADILTFTSVTAANSKQRAAMASGATVRRYTRETRTGTFTSATFAVGFGRNPKA